MENCKQRSDLPPGPSIPCAFLSAMASSHMASLSYRKDRLHLRQVGVPLTPSSSGIAEFTAKLNL